MKARLLAVAMLLFVSLLALASAWSWVVEAQLSVEEAQDLFTRLGCVSCHNGNVALSWDDMLADLRSRYQELGSLDELARNTAYFGQQNAFDSWDNLMEVMARNVGRTLDDPEIQQIKEFFEAYARGEIEEAPQQPEEPAEAPVEEPEAEAKGIPFGLAVVIAAVIVAIVVAGVYMVTRK